MGMSSSTRAGLSRFHKLWHTCHNWHKWSALVGWLKLVKLIFFFLFFFPFFFRFFFVFLFFFFKLTPACHVIQACSAVPGFRHRCSFCACHCWLPGHALSHDFQKHDYHRDVRKSTELDRSLAFRQRSAAKLPGSVWQKVRAIQWLTFAWWRWMCVLCLELSTFVYHV